MIAVRAAKVPAVGLPWTRSAAAGAISLVCALWLGVLSPPALGAAPAAPTITEPEVEGQVLHPADVHMEAKGFSDPDGDTHVCSDWQIVEAGSVVWKADCSGDVGRVHVHLGDGAFVGPYTGRTDLRYAAHYLLRVRFVDSADEPSPFAERGFSTFPTAFEGGPVAWTPTQPGFVVEPVSDSFQLPINIAFVPDPGSAPGDPFLYVVDLYGTIKVVRRDGTVSDYATGLLNFDPLGPFPGSGEHGVAGIAVDPATGDVFASMLYDDGGSGHYAKVDRFHSVDGGLTADSRQTILDINGEPQAFSHQASNLTIGPDGNLYLHNGDGFAIEKALDLDSFRGKILRMDLNGDPLADNPFYDGPPDDSRDYIYAYGFRNPFGGAWRAANHAHYEVENGPSVDRLARIDPGASYGWDGTNASMSTHALYNWSPAHAPVNIAFVQEPTFGGSGFPPSKQDHAFVTESGATYALGPQVLGKRIVEFAPQPGGELGGHPLSFVEYTGQGRASAVGLAAGPDGLYFTELYKDASSHSPIDPGARLMRIRYAGVSPRCTVLGTELRVQLRRGTARIRRRPAGPIAVNGRVCGATNRNMDSIEVTGGRGRQRLILDLSGGRLAPGATGENPGTGEIELTASLGRGRDTLVIRGATRRARRGRAGIRLDGDADADLFTRGVERFLLAR